MAWVPQYIINGGMYGGRYMPEGDLTGFIARFSNIIAVTNGIYARSAYSGASWDGAFGVDSDLILEYALINKDGTNYVFDLMEFDVDNPEGAQFYKQTLVIEGATECSVEQRNEVLIQGVRYWATYVSVRFKVTRIRRREYPTPYSTPTTTTLADFSNQPYVYFTYLTGGSEIALPLGYSNTLYDRCTVVIGFGSYNNKVYFGAGYYSRVNNLTIPPTSNRREYMSTFGAIEKSVIDDAFGVDFKPEEKDDPNDDPDEDGGGKSEEEGGDGNHNRPVDPVPFPDLPPAGGMNAGFVTMYKLAPAEMWLFSQYFFTDTLLEYLRDFFGNPMDIFVGLGIVPFIPEGNELWYPKIGNSVYVSNHPLTKISNQYYVLDCGSIFIEEYGKNCLDYSPYTKILIWLPYIGYRQLPVDEVMGKNIHVKYYCDCLGGDCVALISTQVKPKGMLPPVDVIIAQYNGNILTQVPVASASYDSLVSNVVNSAIGGVGVMADAAAGGLDGSAVSGQIRSMTSTVAGIVNGMKPVLKRDGSPGSSSGLLSVQKPYIIRHIPNQSLPENYRHIMGYPSNLGGTLNDGFEGLAIVEDIQLNNIPAMEPEREEIKELLREGVLI